MLSGSRIARDEINNHSDILSDYHIELIVDTIEQPNGSSNEAGIGLSNSNEAGIVYSCNYGPAHSHLSLKAPAESTLHVVL